MSIGREPKSSPPGMATRARPDPAEQRAEDDDRRPHALDQLVRRLGAALGSPPDEQLVGCGPADVEAHADEQLGHGVDVGDLGDVAKPVLALGQQGGRHQLQGGILGSPDPDRALEGRAGAHDDLVHGPQVSRSGWGRPRQLVRAPWRLLSRPVTTTGPDRPGARADLFPLHGGRCHDPSRRRKWGKTPSQPSRPLPASSRGTTGPAGDGANGT